MTSIEELKEEMEHLEGVMYDALKWYLNFQRKYHEAEDAYFEAKNAYEAAVAEYALDVTDKALPPGSLKEDQ